MSMSGNSHSAALQPSEGHSLNIWGVTFTFKVRGKDTSGAYAMFELTVPPGDRVLAVHRHDHTDESFYVLEGVLKLEIDGEEMTLNPGGFVMIPMGTVHSHGNGGNGPLRLLTIISPTGPSEGGFEEMAKLSASMPPGQPPADRMHELYELGERYDTVYINPLQ